MSAKRRSYSLEVKLAAIEMAKRTDNVKAAARFQTDESSVRKWRLKEKDLQETKDAEEEALMLDDEDAALLDVSGSDDGDDSDSDASIESETSTEAASPQGHASRTRASKAAGCTYAPDCQCPLCEDSDF